MVVVKRQPLRAIRLIDQVRAGVWSDPAQLKAEFRRLCLLVHPDTSGFPGEAFVRLQNDYEDALSLLVAPTKDAAPVFELEDFCRLLRKAQALGLPSRRLGRSPLNRSLMATLVQVARSHSPALGRAVAHYFTAYDRQPGANYNVLELERCFLSGMANFLDAVLFHENVIDRQRAMIRSYLDETRKRLGSEPRHPLAGALGLVEWMAAELANLPG